MNDRSPLDELDLYAYADGLLDDDPLRKADIEARLRAAPETAERVQAYRAQTEALRRRYGPRLADPVPERLHDVLAARPSVVPRRLAQAAAVAAVAVAASLAGWQVGRQTEPQPLSASTFVEQSYRQFTAPLADAPSPLGRAALGEPPTLAWRATDIALTVRVPDLQSLGFSLVGKRTVEVDGNRAVRLEYAAADGRAFSLFLRPRWTERRRAIQVTREGDVSVAFWMDGPLVSVIATRMAPDQARHVADAVQQALHATNADTVVERPIKLRGAPPHGPGTASEETAAAPSSAGAKADPAAAPPFNQALPFGSQPRSIE